MKDNFSTQSDHYAKYRPSYPKEFLEYLLALLPNKATAWDCGTGNGQVAYELAKNLATVYATDISQQQIDHALQAHNLFYSVQPAEQTNFEANQFDLVVVAQAIHWFDFDKFYAEVHRTAKDNAILCIVGYGNLKIAPEIDPIITHLYSNTLGDYWDKERKYIDEQYTTIPFPFEELPTPKLEILRHWTLEHLLGYLNTWSAVKHFTKQNHFNPIDPITPELEKHWHPHQIKEVHFPLLLRIGRIK